MSKKIVDTFNENLSKIKKDVNNLYDKSKTLYLSQLNKSFTSYLELNNIRKEDGDYEDTFQTFNKIEKKENLVYDNDGFNLKYEIIPVEFDDTYYTSADGDIDMKNGEIIAGSFFGYIFNRSKGFWGYKSVEETDFSITLNLKKESLVNKIKFNTNNEVTLKCYIQTINNGELELGEREGKLHSWNFKPDTITGIRITGYGNLISVDYVECGLASYNQNGYLIGVQNKTKNSIEEYNIKDLYNLKLTADVDTPVGTNIEFKYINNNQEYDFKNGEAVLPSGYKVILNQGIYPENTVEDTIIGNIFTSGNYKCFKIYKDYVEDSLEVRYGYNEWQKIDTTYDVSELVPEYINDPNDPDSTITIIDKSHLDSDEYIYINDESIKLEEGCVKQVYQGTDTFELNTDYIPDYREIDQNKIYIKIPSTSKLLDIYINDLKFVIIGKKKEIVKQYKCYVYLNEDDVINVQPFEACNMEIRHVVIDNNIEKDETLRYAFNDYSYLPLIKDVPTVQVQGYKGINMIEFTKFTDNTFTNQSFLDNDYLVIQNYIFYPFKYKLKQVNKLFDNPFEYTIQKIENYEYPYDDDDKNYYLISVLNNNIPDSVANIDNFTISYLRNIGNIDKKIKIKAYLSSSDGLNTPTLRSYKLENTTKSVSDLVIEDIKNKFYTFKLKSNYANNLITLTLKDGSLNYRGETPELMFKKGTRIEYSVEGENEELKSENGIITIEKDENLIVNLYYTLKIEVREPISGVDIKIYKNNILYLSSIQETQEIKFNENETMRYEITKEGYTDITGTVINSSFGSNSNPQYINMIVQNYYFKLSSIPVESRKQVYFIINNVEYLQVDSTDPLITINDIQEGTIIKYIITSPSEDTYTKTFKILEDTEDLDIYVSEQTHKLTINTNFDDASIKIVVNGLDEYNFTGNAELDIVNNSMYAYTVTKNGYISDNGQGNGRMTSPLTIDVDLYFTQVLIDNLAPDVYKTGITDIRTLKIGKTGSYTIEVAGSGGKRYNSNNNSSSYISSGGYLKSTVNLSKNDILYIKSIDSISGQATWQSYVTIYSGNGIMVCLNDTSNPTFVAGGGAGISPTMMGPGQRPGNFAGPGGCGYIGGAVIQGTNSSSNINVAASGRSYDGTPGTSMTESGACGSRLDGRMPFNYDETQVGHSKAYGGSGYSASGYTVQTSPASNGGPGYFKIVLNQ